MELNQEIPCVQVCATSHDDSFKTFKAELYTMIGQAILWKRIHGWPVYLYCDNYTLNLIKELEVSHLWDKIDTLVLEKETNIDTEIFWASSKLRVMNELSAPFFMCDLDFISWFNLNETNITKNAITVYHLEDRKKVTAYSRVNPKSVMLEAGFDKMNNYRWDIDSFNTAAILVMSDALKSIYCNLSLEFMKASSRIKNSQWCNSERMVFAEQRMLGSIVKTLGYKYGTMLKSVYNENGTWRRKWMDKWFNSFPIHKTIHIWLDKFNFKKNPNLEEKYIKVISELIGNSPEFKKINTINPKWFVKNKIE